MIVLLHTYNNSLPRSSAEGSEIVTTIIIITIIVIPIIIMAIIIITVIVSVRTVVAVFTIIFTVPPISAIAILLELTL